MQIMFYNNNHKDFNKNKLQNSIGMQEMAIIRIEMEAELYNQSNLLLIKRNSKEET